VSLAFLASFTLAAQSHPSWWTYASPSATALVGIEWQSVRTSPFADPIEAELWGDLGFPDLPCLHNARHFVISSPELLTLASGNFAGTPLRDQAAQKGFKAMTYRGIDMWFAPEKGEKGTLSVARFTDQLAMIGEPKTLQDAVDRAMDDSRNYSPLLAKAAHLAQKDLWVVSSQLPDDLASRFVPLDADAQGFEGSISVRNGLEIEAVLSAGSDQKAAASGDKLQKAVPTFPAIARTLQVTVEDDQVKLTLSATREQVIAALRGPEPAPKPVEKIRVETPSHVEYVEVEKPPVKSIEKVPEKPQMIRIQGLDEGPREIVMPPPPKPDKP
jgi:hypothetical protein